MADYNKLGGVLAETDDELRRAKDVDLITMPEKIKGTNCGNCKWMRKNDYCANHKVAQEVNERMCCVLWTHSGEYRQFEKRLNKFE